MTGLVPYNSAVHCGERVPQWLGEFSAHAMAHSCSGQHAHLAVSPVCVQRLNSTLHEVLTLASDHTQRKYCTSKCPSGTHNFNMGWQWSLLTTVKGQACRVSVIFPHPHILQGNKEPHTLVSWLRHCQSTDSGHLHYSYGSAGRLQYNLLLHYWPNTS